MKKSAILSVESYERMAFFMSVSVSDEIQLFAQEIQSFLSPNILRDLARDVDFVQRTSKYQAKDLVGESKCSYDFFNSVI
jgi:hypothetical protein